VSYLCILIRCAHRLAELVKGWGPQNGIYDLRTLFRLDSVPCAIATIRLSGVVLSEAPAADWASHMYRLCLRCQTQAAMNVTKPDQNREC
jgi:hypothetical protein